MTRASLESDEIVTIAEVAQRLGMDRSHARKWLLKNGFSFLRVRSAKARNQLTLALHKADAEAAVELRKQQGYLVDRQRAVAVVQQERQNVGHFYIVQVIPEFNPNRIKLGFTTDMDGRLAAHRTAAPTAKLIKTWLCRPTWEEAAIACATRDGCRRIGSEVYDCEDVNIVVSRLEQFFELMPQVAPGNLDQPAGAGEA
jgi:transposase-like protein